MSKWTDTGIQCLRDEAAAIEALIPRVSASFVVDTLTYLHRGGRCSGVAALAGSLLKLHPEILVTGGKMIPGKKYRGKLLTAVQEYVKSREEELLKAKPDHIFITTSLGSDEETAWTKEWLESLNYFKEILVHFTGIVKHLLKKNTIPEDNDISQTCPLRPLTEYHSYHSIHLSYTNRLNLFLYVNL